MISCPKKTISCLCRIYEFVFTNKIDQIYERERERERENFRKVKASLSSFLEIWTLVFVYYTPQTIIYIE